MKIQHVVAALIGVAGLIIAPVAVASAAQQSPQHHNHTPGLDKRKVATIRAATAKFHNIARAEAAGYGGFVDKNGISCIAMPGMGGMGVHWVNGGVLTDPAITPESPEALVYAPDRDGTLRLAAVEYIVDKATWDSKHSRPPLLFPHHPFDVTTAPNRYGLDTFYSQHVWVWKNNPMGPTTMWNPKVNCARA